MLPKKITQCFGFSIDILNRLDPTSLIRIRITGLVGLVVALLSALFGAATFSELSFHGDYFWAIFLVWFVVMLFVELIILGSNLENRGVFATRLVACLLLGIFHSLAVDQYIFKDSITTHLKQNYNREVAMLDSSFHAKEIAPLKRERAKLQERNNELNKGVRKKREAYNIEVTEGANGRPDGEGPYAKFKLNEFKRDSIRAEQLTRANSQRIDRIDSIVDSLNTELALRKQEIPRPEEKGMLDFTKALYQQVWIEGDAFTQGLFILIFLGGLFIESLTLLAKLGFAKAFKIYHQKVERKRNLSAKKDQRVYENEDKIDEIKQEKALQEKLSEIEHNIQLNAIQRRQKLSIEEFQARLAAIKKKANLIFEAIKETEDLDKEVREVLNDPQQYQQYGKSLIIEYQLEKIKEVSDDMRNRDA